MLDKERNKVEKHLRSKIIKFKKKGNFDGFRDINNNVKLFQLMK